MFKAAGKSSGHMGTKVLLEAMSNDKVHLAKFILDALDGKIVDSKMEGAQTPLMSSVLLPDGQTRPKFMELLLQRGANVNCQDQQGRTALSYACERGYLDAVKILVRNNADPEIVDAWGNSALMYATVAGQSTVVEFLVRAFKRLGLQIDRQNKVGNSAVEVARFLGHTECLVALTNNARKIREDEGRSLGNAQRQVSLERDLKVEPPVRRFEVLQTHPVGNNRAEHDGAFQSRPAGRRKSSLKSRLPSMDYIEEFERENDSSPSSPQEPVLSVVRTPKPPPRTTNHSLPKDEEKLITIEDHLPPLSQGSEPQKPVFFSPRPGKTTAKPCASTNSAPTALGILLTPIITNKSEITSEKEKQKTFDFGARRFHDSYYQKRCSLPTSIHSPTPPDRTLMPSHKSQTIRRCATSPTKVETLNLSAPVATPTATFSVLSSKLLRRFTFPEFKRGVKALEEGAQSGGDSTLASTRISRSETYPQVTRHPQVGSKPSIDSISAVKCEFDFYFRTPPS